MSRKILFLGYNPFLGTILNELEDSRFLEDNIFDVIIARPNSYESFLKGFKRLVKQKNVKRIWEELALRLQLLLYKSNHARINKCLFNEISLKSLKSKKNISFLDYNGLETIENLESYDFMIVASFGIKIPEYIFNAPKGRTLNIHPSYLPELRGGYPTYVSAFIMESTSACTLHYMENGWDSGEIISQKKESIDQKATNEIRFKKSAEIAAKLLHDLNDSNFIFESKKQEKSKISYCHKIIKYKKYLKNIEKDRLEGYVLANYSKSLFPFTYGYYRGFIIMILEVEKLEKCNNVVKISIYKKDSQLHLQHYDTKFLLKKYIYKGKLTTI